MNLLRKRKPLEPVQFVPVKQVFRPEVKVRTLRDINGWADRDKRLKWHIGAGQIGLVPAEKAREWHTKGYVEILEGEVKPVSEDEKAEMLSTVTTLNLNLGAENG